MTVGAWSKNGHRPWMRHLHSLAIAAGGSHSGTLSRDLCPSGRGAYGSQSGKRKFLSSTSHNVSPRIGLRSQNALICAPLPTGKRAGDEAWVLGSFLVLQEIDVLASPSVLNQPRHLLWDHHPQTGCSRLPSRYCPHLSSPQTVPSLFPPVCGHLCYAYSNTNSIEQITSEEE